MRYSHGRVGKGREAEGENVKTRKIKKLNKVSLAHHYVNRWRVCVVTNAYRMRRRSRGLEVL